MRATRPYAYLGTVTGMCRECRRLVPARVVEENGAVYQERLCAQCGTARARIADDAAWYRRTITQTVRCKPARRPGTAVRNGCPFDCGPCAFHANACHLPVFSITNACNMACPICFTYNRPTPRYFMSREELRSLLDRLIERAGPFDLVNLTGGEPTLHPELLSLLAECRRPEIGRVTVNSNGLRLAADEDLCRALADQGAYVILSFDTLRSETARTLHGRDVVAEKLKALEHLERFGVGTTLLNVLLRGVNDAEIGDIVALARRHAVVRSLTVQTMTFTGQGGAAFRPREHLPLDGAAQALEDATDGAIRAEHFFPHAGAHPLCYSVAYYLKDGDQLCSLTEFFSVDELRLMLGHGYLLQPEDASQERFHRAIDRLWAEGDARRRLPALKRLLGQLYPPDRALTPAERQAVAERSLFTVYLHAHMDEDTLDLARLVACPDQVPDADGRLIPACAYNLFYRRNDPRFWNAAATP